MVIKQQSYGIQVSESINIILYSSVVMGSWQSSKLVMHQSMFNSHIGHELFFTKQTSLVNLGNCGEILNPHAGLVFCFKIDQQNSTRMAVCHLGHSICYCSVCCVFIAPRRFAVKDSCSLQRTIHFLIHNQHTRKVPVATSLHCVFATVCLSVCLRDNSKSFRGILMKFLMGQDV